MNTIERAKEFAHVAHDSIRHKRKYTGEHYWVHTDAVAKTIQALPVSYIPMLEAMVVAAHLHDVPEDVNKEGFNLYTIYTTFGPLVGAMVDALTDKYIPEKYPGLNRAERKVLEAWRLSKASWAVQTIKVADLMDNTQSIVKYDPGFARTYLTEKAYLLSVMKNADPDLMKKARKQLRAATKKLNLVK